MDLKRIEHLVHVAEYGSFSKAASVLGIAQPALGRQIRKLEEECGVQLLHRNGRGVMLTPDGERLLERVRPLVRQLQAVVSQMNEERDRPSGLVTVGLTPTVARLIGLELITTMQQRYPAIRVNCVVGYSGYVHEWLTDARLDVAILHDARRSQHLAVDEIAVLDLCLISGAKSLAPRAREMTSVRLEDIEGLPLVLPTANHGLRRSMAVAASERGISLRIEYEIDALELMIELVLAGAAHTVLSAGVVKEFVARGELVARKITEPGVKTRLMLAKASNRPMTRAVRVTESCLKQLLHGVSD
ncbi:DNA-binding transcriptional regulator OxyR [soil metagenome]